MSDGEADRLLQDEPVLSRLIAPIGATMNAAALGRARDAKAKVGSGSGCVPNLQGLMPIQPTTQISAAMAAMGGTKTVTVATGTAAAGRNVSASKKVESWLGIASSHHHRRRRRHFTLIGWDNKAFG